MPSDETTPVDPILMVNRAITLPGESAKRTVVAPDAATESAIQEVFEQIRLVNRTLTEDPDVVVEVQGRPWTSVLNLLMTYNPPVPPVFLNTLDDEDGIIGGGDGSDGVAGLTGGSSGGAGGDGAGGIVTPVLDGTGNGGLLGVVIGDDEGNVIGSGVIVIDDAGVITGIDVTNGSSTGLIDLDGLIIGTITDGVPSWTDNPPTVINVPGTTDDGTDDLPSMIGPVGIDDAIDADDLDFLGSGDVDPVTGYTTGDDPNTYNGDANFDLNAGNLSFDPESGEAIYNPPYYDSVYDELQSSDNPQGIPTAWLSAASTVDSDDWTDDDVEQEDDVHGEMDGDDVYVTFAEDVTSETDDPSSYPVGWPANPATPKRFPYMNQVRIMYMWGAEYLTYSQGKFKQYRMGVRWNPRTNQMVPCIDKSSVRVWKATLESFNWFMNYKRPKKYKKRILFQVRVNWTPGKSLAFQFRSASDYAISKKTRAVRFKRRLVIPRLAIGTVTWDDVPLTWNASKNADGYKVSRTPWPVKGMQNIASPETNSYDDTGMLDGKRYLYKVRATTNNGPGFWSYYSAYKMVQVPVRPPYNLLAVQDTPNRYQLLWDTTARGDTTEVYRKHFDETEFTMIARTQNNSLWVDVPANSHPVFKFKAYNTRSYRQKIASEFSEELTLDNRILCMNKPYILSFDGSDQPTIYSVALLPLPWPPFTPGARPFTTKAYGCQLNSVWENNTMTMLGPMPDETMMVNRKLHGEPTRVWFELYTATGGHQWELLHETHGVIEDNKEYVTAFGAKVTFTRVEGVDYTDGIPYNN